MEERKPISYIIRETWLSRQPDPLAGFAMALASLGVVLLSLISWNNFFGLEPWMAAWRQAVFQDHQYWRAWSTLFVHGDGKHLLGNLFLFFVMGNFLTAYFGISRVLLAALAFGGLTNFVVLWGMPAEVRLIGLSGVVFWMGGAWLTLYFLIDRKRSLMQRFLRAGGVALVLFMPAEAFDPSVSYKSHFVGFLLGVFAGFVFFIFKRDSFRAAEIKEAEIEEVDPIPAFENERNF